MPLIKWVSRRIHFVFLMTSLLEVSSARELIGRKLISGANLASRGRRRAMLGDIANYDGHKTTENDHYGFQYFVDDPFRSGNDFGHREHRNGDITRGMYYVLLPDGRRQTVNYYVSGASGYVARISYDTQPTRGKLVPKTTLVRPLAPLGKPIVRSRESGSDSFEDGGRRKHGGITKGREGVLIHQDSSNFDDSKFDKNDNSPEDVSTVVNGFQPYPRIFGILNRVYSRNGFKPF